MINATFPQPFRQPSERSLMGPVTADFEQFYRATLRYRSGGRVRALEVARMYQAWADRVSAPAMNLRQIRRAMLNIGHRHFRSNITYFGDVQLAADAPDLADNFPEAPAFAEPELGIWGGSIG